MDGVHLEFAITIGGVGVSIFFTISGFIMVYNSFHSFGSSDAATDFFCRRLLRIVPLYLIATLLQFLNKYNTSHVYDFRHLIYSFFFIPYIGEGGNYRPVLGVGWTLNLEMFFYLIFAISLVVPSRLGFALSILVLSSLAFVNIIGMSSALGPGSFYAQSILLYFVAGIVIGIIFKTHKPKPVAGELTALAGSVLFSALQISLIISEDAAISLVTGILTASISVYLCATAAVGRNSLVTLLLNNLGNASYSVYLFHGFFLGAIKRLPISQIITGPLPLLFYVSVVVIATNAIGFFIYKYLERPITKAGKGFYARLSAVSRSPSFGSK